ncbi:MAG: class F sortase [Kouleothrix sp.]
MCPLVLLSACGLMHRLRPRAPTVLPVATSAPVPTDDPNALPGRAERNQRTADCDEGAPEPSATPAPAPTEALIVPPTQPPTAAPRPTAKPVVKPATPAPAAAPAAKIEPARLVIDDIGLDYRPVSVGLDRNNVPIVPNHDVGWYNLSAAPGQGDNIVFWGHVLRFRSAPKIAAPFARLKELKPGASVVVYDSSGAKHSYVITKQVWVTPDQVEYILPQGKEIVTLVSCIGDKVIQDGEVVDESHRLITIAELAT